MVLSIIFLGMFWYQIGTILDFMVRMDRIRDSQTRLPSMLGKFVNPCIGCRGIDHGMSDGEFQKEFCSHPKRYLAKAISYRECRKNDINENAGFNNDNISDYRFVHAYHVSCLWLMDYESYVMSHLAIINYWQLFSNIQPKDGDPDDNGLPYRHRFPNIYSEVFQVWFEPFYESLEVYFQNGIRALKILPHFHRWGYHVTHNFKKLPKPQEVYMPMKMKLSSHFWMVQKSMDLDKILPIWKRENQNV